MSTVHHCLFCVVSLEMETVSHILLASPSSGFRHLIEFGTIYESQTLGTHFTSCIGSFGVSDLLLFYISSITRSDLLDPADSVDNCGTDASHDNLARTLR